MAAPPPSRWNALKAEAILPHFVRRSAAQQFLLAEMPKELRDALADYDVDGDGAPPLCSSPACCRLRLGRCVPMV